MVKSSAVRVLMLLVMLSAGAAEAAQRTFVSAASGSDANPCSRALPCRSFGTAISQTDAGGEVVVLDSGGYGPVLITKSVAIIAPAGVHAAVTALSGSAIEVAGASTDVVVLRGLYLNGLGADYGVLFTSGKTLHVESCVISGFGQIGVYGSALDADLYVIDTVARQNLYAFYLSAGPPIRASLESIQAHENHSAFVGGASSLMTVTRSVASGNTAAAFNADDSSSVINVESCTATMNGTGIYAFGTIRVRNSMITGNTTGVATNPGGGTTISFGNNGVHGNGINGTFTSTVAQQ